MLKIKRYLYRGSFFSDEGYLSIIKDSEYPHAEELATMFFDPLGRYMYFTRINPRCKPSSTLESSKKFITNGKILFVVRVIAL
jgi:hypothetical protein